MSIEMAIQVNDLSKKYSLYAKPQDRFKEAIGLHHRSYHNDFFALQNVSFEVKKGETVGIIGTNGSGKSTLLKMITGVLNPSSGSLYVQGRISALLELGAGFNQEYTGLENIYLNGRMMGYSRREMEKKADAIIGFAEIGDFINQPVKTYSSGMFARLAFAVAINVEPDILIVDEALSVGDLFFQNKCFRKFEDLKKRGVTILFVSHDISSVRQMCSRVLWIEKGRQMMFDQSDFVCDTYMDMKRMDMNKQQDLQQEEGFHYLAANRTSKNIVFPAITYKNSAIETDRLEIISVYLQDANNENITIMEVDKTYSFHVVVRLHHDMDRLIFGVVVENEKGIPLYDLNNFINDGKVIRGSKDEVIEAVFSFKLPRVMKGVYIVSAAVAQGSQEQHVMLTWLHGVLSVEVVNRGYNSSYIEIPATIACNIYDNSCVRTVSAFTMR